MHGKLAMLGIISHVSQPSPYPTTNEDFVCCFVGGRGGCICPVFSVALLQQKVGQLKNLPRTVCCQQVKFQYLCGFYFLFIHCRGVGRRRPRGWGALPFFFLSTPGDLNSLCVPTPGNLPIFFFKKRANARGDGHCWN